jgi:hypothetical protein
MQVVRYCRETAVQPYGKIIIGSEEDAVPAVDFGLPIHTNIRNKKTRIALREIQEKSFLDTRRD